MWRIERVRFLHHTCPFEKRDVLISCSCRSSSFHSSPAFLSKTWKTSSNPASGKQQVICGCFVRKKTTWSEGLLSFPLKRLNSGNNNPFLQSSWHRTSRKPVMTTYVLQTEGGNKLPLLSLFLCNQFLLLHEREPWRDYKMRGNTTRKRNISRIITVFPVNEERTWTFSWRRRLPKKANRHSFYSSKRLLDSPATSFNPLYETTFSKNDRVSNMSMKCTKCRIKERRPKYSQDLHTQT